MGVKVKGIKQVVSKVNRAIDNVQDKKTVRALHSALLIIGGESASMVPIDTGTLLSSQFRDLSFVGTKIKGKVGYSANYALSVHEAAGVHLGKHTLRPVKKGQAKGSRGYIWDKTGEPKFLDKAVTKTRDSVDSVIHKEMSL
ncbi:hypothetical protein [Pantoea sp. A4]|uniref:hypothetical protein n=1 Tax=Pantoea sp. A4 TaxID=1225184 RepID=UPI00036D33CC|nr:hypothetical protein [Pantoea sp. A4]